VSSKFNLVVLLLACSGIASAQTRQAPIYQISPHTSQQLSLQRGQVQTSFPTSLLSLRLSPAAGGIDAQYEHRLPNVVDAHGSIKIRVTSLTQLDTDFARFQPFDYPLGRILLYWGCGEKARTGQPRVLHIGKDMGSLSRRLPPRPAQDKTLLRLVNVPQDMRLVAFREVLPPNAVKLEGEHTLTGPGRPAQFSVSELGEFLPPITISRSEVAADGSVDVQWKTTARVAAYFANVFLQQTGSRDVVIWTSSRIGEAGWVLSQSHPGRIELERLLANGVLLPADTSSCTIPADVARHAVGALIVQVHGFDHELDVLSQSGNGDAAMVVQVTPRATTTLMFLDARDERSPRVNDPPASRRR